MYIFTNLDLYVNNTIDHINYYLTTDQINNIIAIVDHNDNIIKPNQIYTICRPASNLVYYIKELYEYVLRARECELNKLYEYRRLVEEKKNFEKFKK
jgi:hypothetical protein